MTEQFFRIRNFEKFQHYHDRKPPWIKLYRDLWDDPRFFDLENGDRYLLIGLFVIASQHDNRIPFKQSWLKSQLLTSKPIPLQMLIDTGWIELLEQDASAVLAASDTLAERYPSRARGESETEKSREETEKIIIPCLAFGEFGRVHLTEEQHAKLKVKLGDSLDAYIDRFDRWVNEAPEAKASGVRRRDRHAYESILNWFDGAKTTGGNGNGRQPKSRQDITRENAESLLRDYENKRSIQRALEPGDPKHLRD